MSAPAVVVFAYSDVGHACLRLLLERGVDVRAVYTHADAPAEEIWFPSVGRLAHDAAIPVRVDADLARDDEQERLRALAPELVFSFYYRRLLPAAVLDVPRLGAFNIHGSLLPRYRGRAPVNWAVLRGERETGATLHAMTARADAGDIVDQEPVSIGPDDTAAEVQERVRDAAVAMLDRQLEALLHGTAPRRPQDESLAFTVRRRRPEDGAFEWSWPAVRIHDLVRAVTHPYPGAFTMFGDGRRLTVWRTGRVAGAVPGSAAPGTMRIVADRVLVACGDDSWLELLRAQLENEPELSGAPLAHRLAAPGESVAHPASRS